ncbi:hypothetical protein [Paenarthrobacter sp. C1]|uniref:hypothetical protein n=1 Tax=Paenarthrobacter sp. C1 TaxID=3400220 RepID=UPI003BF5F7EB
MTARDAAVEALLKSMQTSEAAVHAAMQVNVRALMDAVGAIADHYTPPTERLVVFRCRYVEAREDLREEMHDCDDPECPGMGPALIPELAQVEVHTATTTHALAPGGVDGDWWELAVSTWLGLREAVSMMTVDLVGGGLVIDPDNYVYASWLGEHCPDVGPLPERLLDFSASTTQAAEDHDPFAALLEDDSRYLDAAEEVLLSRMDAFKVDPPSIPSHDPDEPCC